MTPTIGGLIGGKYRVIRLIGEGGMGSVYEAQHEQLGTRVALKFLHPDLAEQQTLVARFLQEARVSARIKSPHVTRVMDVDQTPDGDAYFVMELLEGESLEQRMQRTGPLGLEETLEIGLQILSALEAAHAEGVVHRDLKPDNVWLTPVAGAPWVKLLDFGIAKLRTTNEFQSVQTRPGSMMGTPAYMAPEQAISADQVDVRADLYSFGVMTYEMLSGQRPVPGDDISEILERLVRGEARPLHTICPGVPLGLSALIDALVSPNPDDRPRSASAVRSEIAYYAHSSNPPPSRLSVPVPGTVPPDEPGLPPYVARLSSTGTSIMPGPPLSLGTASTAPAEGPVPNIAPRRRRHTGWIVAGVLVAAVGLGAGLWAYASSSMFDDPLPPLPTAIASSHAIQIPQFIDPGVPIGPAERRRAAQAPSRERESERTPLPVPTFPQIPIPFPIPSGIIPSTLPPMFPPMPQGASGIEAPVAPSSSASP